MGLFGKRETAVGLNSGGPDSTGYTLDSLDPEVRMDTYSFASEETLTLKSDSSLNRSSKVGRVKRNELQVQAGTA